MGRKTQIRDVLGVTIRVSTVILEIVLTVGLDRHSPNYEIFVNFVKTPMKAVNLQCYYFWSDTLC